jgi:hypothetical protein
MPPSALHAVSKMRWRSRSFMFGILPRFTCRGTPYIEAFNKAGYPSRPPIPYWRSVDSSEYQAAARIIVPFNKFEIRPPPVKPERNHPARGTYRGESAYVT